MRKEISGIECIVENPGQSNAVVLFHGFGADCSDLAPLAEYLDADRKWTWIFPNGPQTVDIGYAMTGRAWFPIAAADLQQMMLTGKAKDYATAQPPQLPQVLSQLQLFVADLKSQYEGVAVGGFSQGGMVASHLMCDFAEKLKGVVLLSTVLLNTELLSKHISGFKGVPVFQSHGSRDQVLPVQQALSLYQFLKKAGWPGEWREFSGGHEIPPQVLMNLKIFLDKNLV